MWEPTHLEQVQCSSWKRNFLIKKRKLPFSKKEKKIIVIHFPVRSFLHRFEVHIAVAHTQLTHLHFEILFVHPEDLCVEHLECWAYTCSYIINHPATAVEAESKRWRWWEVWGRGVCESAKRGVAERGATTNEVAPSGIWNSRRFTVVNIFFSNHPSIWWLDNAQ